VTLTLHDWDVSACTTFTSFLINSSALTTVDFNKWTLNSSPIVMNSMFQGCAKLETVNCNDWDTSAVTNMTYMFSNCAALTDPNIADWDTSAVTNMSLMFYSCGSLTTPNVGSWDTSAVQDMSYMFYGCTALTEPGVSGFSVPLVTTMGQMFDGSTLTTAAYDEILIAWAAQAPNLKSNVPLHAGSSTTYSTGSPTVARAVLTDTYNWTITDGGSAGTPYPGDSGPAEWWWRRRHN